MRFATDNRNTETADNVGSFRIWILGPKTPKKMRFAVDKQQQKKMFLQLIIEIRELPTISALSVFGF